MRRQASRRHCAYWSSQHLPCQCVRSLRRCSNEMGFPPKGNLKASPVLPRHLQFVPDRLCFDCSSTPRNSGPCGSAEKPGKSARRYRIRTASSTCRFPGDNPITPLRYLNAQSPNGVNAARVHQGTGRPRHSGKDNAWSVSNRSTSNEKRDVDLDWQRRSNLRQPLHSMHLTHGAACRLNSVRQISSSCSRHRSQHRPVHDSIRELQIGRLFDVLLADSRRTGPRPSRPDITPERKQRRTARERRQRKIIETDLRASET